MTYTPPIITDKKCARCGWGLVPASAPPLEAFRLFARDFPDRDPTEPLVAVCVACYFSAVNDREADDA